jgi:tetratricopeptide (TPR) repeat protein
VSGDRWLACVVALGMMFAAARAVAGDTRELQAREEFAAGRYQQALDLFAKLYAETLHPVYLRNIGRCYQNLGDPDRAIISFRDYLRKHKTISVEERKEVDDFIAEMEQLRKQKAGAATPPPETSTAAPQAASAITPLPSAPEPANSGAAAEALVTAPGGGAHEESLPVYTRWWFWTIVGAAAVGAGLGIAAAAGAFTRVEDASCPMGYSCQP